VMERSSDAPGKTEGGGRYNFQMTKLTFKSRGQVFVGQELEPGDKIEFFVQVYPDGKYSKDGTDIPAQRPPGRSEIRGKDIVSFKDWQEALRRREQQEDRLKELRKQQEKVTPINTSFLNRQVLPGGWQQIISIARFDTVFPAVHEVRWETCPRGKHLRHYYLGGYSC